MKTHYKYTKFSEKQRIGVALLLYFFTALALFFVPSMMVNTIVALLFLGFAAALFSSSNFTNKPVDIGKEDWQVVTMTEIARVKFQIKKMKNAPIPFLYTIGFAIVITVLFVGAELFIFFALNNISLIVATMALYVIFFPFLWTARIDRWYPVPLATKLGEFEQVLQYSYPQSIQVVPSLRFDQTEEGDKLPEDCKFMLSYTPESGRDIKDLVGIQIQLTHNTGPNGSVPYFYSVVITKGREDSWRKLSKFESDGFVCESGGDDEYGTLVIRQDTKIRTDGYHTNIEDVNRLIETSIQAVSLLS